jgi:hypothetical protein
LINIYQVTDGEKDVEANSKWKDNVDGLKANFKSKQGKEVYKSFDEKVEILKNDQRTDVDYQSGEIK